MKSRLHAHLTILLIGLIALWSLAGIAVTGINNGAITGIAIALNLYYALFILKTFTTINAPDVHLLTHFKAPMYAATLLLAVMVLIQRRYPEIDFGPAYFSIALGFATGISRLIYNGAISRNQNK